MRASSVLAGTALLLGTLLTGAPAHAHGDAGRIAEQRALLSSDQSQPLISSGNVTLASSNPSAAGISGCFLKTKPLFVQSNLDSIRVYDVSKPTRPALTGVLPSLQFENEAMNCGERRYRKGKIRRFALVGVDLYQASPDDISHANAGGGELVVVDVTDPKNPRITGRTPGSTSTHTLACVDQTNCTYAYSAGSDKQSRFSIFDLRNLDRPRRGRLRPEDAGSAGLLQPDGGPQVGLRRRRHRHPHRLQGRLDVERQPAPEAAGDHHDRTRGPGHRPAVPRLERLHPAQLPAAERQGVQAPQEPRRRPTATSCSSPRRTTSRPTAPRPARSRPGGSSASTAPPTRSFRWTRSSSPTSVPSRCPRARSAPRTGSTTTPRGSSRPGSTAAAPSSWTSATRGTSSPTGTPPGVSRRCGTPTGCRSTTSAA